MTDWLGLLDSVKAHRPAGGRRPREGRAARLIEEFGEGHAVTGWRRNAQMLGEASGFRPVQQLEVAMSDETTRAEQRGIKVGKFTV
jgi:hypothetical protein